MTFSLYVQTDRWRAQAVRVCAAVDAALADDPTFGPRDHSMPTRRSIVPVVKGNGYGLGQARAAAEATRLGVETVAVGTVWEVPATVAEFPGDVLVLQPYDPMDAGSVQAWVAAEELAGDRLIRTIADRPALNVLLARPSGTVRVVVEALTSTRRFGLESGDLLDLLADASLRSAVDSGRLRLEGLALHLPMVQPDQPAPRSAAVLTNESSLDPVQTGSARVREAVDIARLWLVGCQRLVGENEAGTATGAHDARKAASGQSRGDLPEQLWVSHLDDVELSQLRTALPGLPIRPRIGTRLWHGDRAADRAMLQARGTVLAVHPPHRGGVGYTQRRGPRGASLVVVSGGTSHGVALEAPGRTATLRQRAVAVAEGALEATGRALSPFRHQGRNLWFADTPHMHVSLVWVPRGMRPPTVGDELDCTVRLATARFDRVLGLDHRD